MKYNHFSLLFIIFILFFIQYTNSQNISKLSDKLVYTGDGWNYEFEIIIFSGIDIGALVCSVTPSIFSRISLVNNKYYHYKLTIPYAASGLLIEPIITSRSSSLNLGSHSFIDKDNSWVIKIVDPPNLLYRALGQILFKSTIKINNIDPSIKYDQVFINCQDQSLLCSIYDLTGDSYLIIFSINSQDFMNQVVDVTIYAGANSVQGTFNLNFDPLTVLTVTNYNFVISRLYYFSKANIVYDKSKVSYGIYDLLTNNIVGLKYPVGGIPGNATFIMSSQIPVGSKYGDAAGIGALGSNKIYVSMIANPVEPSTIIQTPSIPFLSDIKIEDISGTGYSGKDIGYSLNGTATYISEGYVYAYHEFPFSYSNIISTDSEKGVVYKKRFSLVYSSTTSIKFDSSSLVTEVLPIIDTTSPIVTSFSLCTIQDSRLFIMRIKVTDDMTGFKSFTYRGITITAENIVSGNITNGVFEKIFSPLDDGYRINKADDGAILMDFSQNIQKYNSSLYFANSLSTISYFESPSINRVDFNYENFTRFEFSTTSEIDTTGKETKLQLLFNVTYPKKDEIVFITFTENKLTLNDISYYYKNGYIYQGFWNSTLNLYQIDFTIKRNQFTTSNLNYQLFFDFISVDSKEIQNYLKNSNSILKVRSNYANTLGPVVKSVNFYVIPSGSIGWIFNIESSVNNFKSGYAIIKNFNSLAFYNVTLQKGQNTNEYKANLFVNLTTCTSSIFYLNYTQLEDEGGYKTVFENQNNLINPIPTPFLNQLIPPISTSCVNTNDDLKGPEIKAFKINRTTLSVFSDDRIIEISFEFYDESGIDVNFLPYVYLTTTHLNSYIKVQAQLVNQSLDSTLVRYYVSCEIPRGFGYPLPILINIFSVYDLYGHFTGLSSFTLSKLNYPSILKTSNNSLDITYFSTISSISTSGGLLTVTGNSFKKNEIPVSITIDYSTSFDEPTTPIFLESTIFIINVKPIKYPFTLKASFNGNLLEQRIIYPIGWELPPVVTPPPTNPPNQQKCPNNCGGTSKGVCSVDTFVCVCYSPWIGDDCSSKIIIISPPAINTTSPNINISIPEEDNNNNDHQLKSLISIKELREISIEGKIIKRYTFESWIFTNQSNQEDTKYLYSYSIKNKENQDELDCNINVLIQYFKNKTEVNFAGNTIKMSESSLKYNVNITSYPFKSQLNTLLLVMSTSIQSNSNSNDICTSKDFGYEDSINQYMTVQVDHYKLYGRFINRGIIDSNIQKIDNILLNSDSLLIDNSNSKLSNSFIGIKIPYFRGIAQLDPDFSVLVTNNKANSICDKSGLTNSQIAGIVVGGVVFVSILVIVSILLIKSTRGKLLINNIKLKKILKTNK